jgi:acyl-CoA dehydrogenase
MTYLFETDEHAAMRQIARRFASSHVAPHGAEWEENEEFPIELYRQAAVSGLTPIGYPEAVGGAGGDLGHVLVAGEELILAGRSVGTAVGLGSHGIALPPIVRFGTPEQQRRFVGPSRVAAATSRTSRPARCATATTTSSPARRRSSRRAVAPTW